jgi:hypothetical protein
MLLPLEIPPGIVKTDSPNAAKGRFTDSDKVRFYNGFPEKWSGWETFIPDTLLGVCRGAVSWSNKYGNTNAALGTHLKLYAMTGDDTISDITPIAPTGTINTDPFETTSGETLVTVTDTSHGADTGGFVTFSGAAASGGITISGEYQIVTIIDTDSYTIDHSAAATSSTTGGGASVTATYQIAIGTTGGTVGLGWSSGAWGAGTWGTPRTEGIPLDARVWSLVEYGNDLMASPSGGTIYLWEEATDVTAKAVANAPAYCRAMFVTGERFVFALGAGADGTTPMTVKWPDQDDITEWTPSVSNTANSRTLQSGSRIINGTPLSDGVNLVWSDTSLYVFQYTGSDFVYDSRLAGTNCGLVAPLGFAKVSGVAFWISGDQFYMYASGVQPIPNNDDVSDWVFNRMDTNQITKTFAIYDQKQNQVRWHYCSTGNTEPDSYVDVSLDGSWTWTVGTLSRTGGTQYRQAESSMLLVDENGVIFSHGVGKDADGAAMEAWVTFGLYAIASAQANVDVMGIVPDCERQVGDLDFEIYTKERPNSASNLDEQTVTLAPTDEIGDARVAGRHFGQTVRSNSIAGDFRLGIVNLEINQSGARR